MPSVSRRFDKVRHDGAIGELVAYCYKNSLPTLLVLNYIDESVFFKGSELNYIIPNLYFSQN